MNSPLRAGVIRGTVHPSRKRAVRTAYGKRYVRKRPDTGAARCAVGCGFRGTGLALMDPAANPERDGRLTQNREASPRTTPRDSPPHGTIRGAETHQMAKHHFSAMGGVHHGPSVPEPARSAEPRDDGMGLTPGRSGGPTPGRPCGRWRSGSVTTPAAGGSMSSRTTPATVTRKRRTLTGAAGMSRPAAFRPA